MNNEKLEKLIYLGILISIVSFIIVIAIGIQMSSDINEMREDITELQEKVDIYENVNENYWSELEKSTDLTDFEHNTSENYSIDTLTYDSSMQIDW